MLAFYDQGGLVPGTRQCLDSHPSPKEIFIIWISCFMGAFSKEKKKSRFVDFYPFFYPIEQKQKGNSCFKFTLRVFFLATIGFFYMVKLEGFLVVNSIFINKNIFIYCI